MKAYQSILCSLITTIAVSSCGDGSSSNSTNTNSSSGKLLTEQASNDSISISSLETEFERQFCQINPSLGVSLQSAECQSNITYIASQSGTNYFDLNKKPILNNALGIQSIDFSKITYLTSVNLPSGASTYTVSGGIAFPNGVDKTKIKGVLVFFHGTQMNKQQVGSNLSAPNTQLAISVFASQGYIVVMPDYIGQGDDYANIHPYVLYPEITAKTAADMLTAAKPLIQKRYNLTDPEQIKLFSAGYSEGGAYSLWFNTFLTKTPSVINRFYKLTHSFAGEGAYNTSKITKGFLFDEVSTADGNLYNIQNTAVTTLAKPILYANALASYATYSNGGSYATVFNPTFFSMTCSGLFSDQSKCNVNGSNISIEQALRFKDTDPSSSILYSAFKKSTDEVTYAGELEAISGSKSNSGIALSISADFNKSSSLLAALSAADVNLQPLGTNAVSVISLDADSIVSPKNYDWLTSTYGSKIKTSIKIDHSKILVVSPLSKAGDVKYSPIDHPNAPPYQFLYMLNEFNLH